MKWSELKWCDENWRVGRHKIILLNMPVCLTLKYVNKAKQRENGFSTRITTRNIFEWLFVFMSTFTRIHKHMQRVVPHSLSLSIFSFLFTSFTSLCALPLFLFIHIHILSPFYTYLHFNMCIFFSPHCEKGPIVCALSIYTISYRCVYQIQWLLFSTSDRCISAEQQLQQQQHVNDIKHKMCANFHFVCINMSNAYYLFFSCVCVCVRVFDQQQFYSITKSNARPLTPIKNFLSPNTVSTATTTTTASSSEIEVMYLMWCVYDSHKYLW